MDRRAFVRTGIGFTGAAMLSTPHAFPQNIGAPDLVLRGGTIYDGTGARPFEADIAITGDRVSAVGKNLSAGEVLDVRGLAVAPGFIDIHSHTDLVLLVNPKAESKIRQGVTTEVVGQDGSSIGPWSDAELAEQRESYRRRYNIDIDFKDLAGFFRRLRAQGSAINVASMVGSGTIRGTVVGDANRPASAEELERMVALVRDALRDGACGVSSGLEYAPNAFADRAELAALAAPFKESGLPYATHMRNEDDQLFAAIEEAIAIGRMAGVPVEISHLKAQGQRNWWKALPVIDMIEAARSSGVDVTFDCYPYIAYSTGLSNLFPIWALDGGTAAFLARVQDPGQRARIESYVRGKIDQLGSWDAVQVTSVENPAVGFATGRKLGALAKERSIDPYALLVDIVIRDQNRAGMVGFGMSEENVERFLAHPLGMICSDAGARATYGPLSEGAPHPRAYGAFPRVLGHYCRERNVMPLETAIHKMTGMTAARLKLQGRGRIAPGAFADVVAFDPARVADTATFEKPHQYAKGIPHVIVNGKLVIRDGEHTGALPGQIVKPGGAA